VRAWGALWCASWPTMTSTRPGPSAAFTVCIHGARAWTDPYPRLPDHPHRALSPAAQPAIARVGARTSRASRRARDPPSLDERRFRIECFFDAGGVPDGALAGKCGKGYFTETGGRRHAGEARRASTGDVSDAQACAHAERIAGTSDRPPAGIITEDVVVQARRSSDAPQRVYHQDPGGESLGELAKLTRDGGAIRCSRR